MDPKEYRIGNLLRDKVSKTLLEVIELTKEDIVTHVIDRSMFPLKDGWSLEPIPLTHEWLIKLGYTSDEPILSEKPSFYRKGNHKIWCPFDQFLDDYYRFEIKYVHQLQNLYFATQQEELKL